MMLILLGAAYACVVLLYWGALVGVDPEAPLSNDLLVLYFVLAAVWPVSTLFSWGVALGRKWGRRSR